MFKRWDKMISLAERVMMMIFGRIDYACEWLKGDDDDFWENR